MSEDRKTNKEQIEIPWSVSESLSSWFYSRKGHRKARYIKPIKRRFMKKYGKETGAYFDMVCLNPWTRVWPK